MPMQLVIKLERSAGGRGTIPADDRAVALGLLTRSRELSRDSDGADDKL